MAVKYLAAMMLAVSVLLVSGCVVPGLGPSAAAGTGPGVVVLNWEPDFPEIQSNETVRLAARMQNQGQVDARDVRAFLTNIYVPDWNNVTSAEVSIGSLVAVNLATDTPGQVYTHSWGLRAPDISTGAINMYQPLLKVQYDYKTTAKKSVTLVDVDELRKLKQQGRPLPSNPTTVSAGPVTVEIQAGNYIKAGAGAGTFPIHIKVINTEWEKGGSAVRHGSWIGGSVYNEVPQDTKAAGGKEYNTLVPTFDYPIAINVTPPRGIEWDTTNVAENCTVMVWHDLWKGKDTELTCLLRIEDSDAPAFREEREITVDLFYRYETEATTSVQVSGMSGRGRPVYEYYAEDLV
jgi:hypothetical protein